MTTQKAQGTSLLYQLMAEARTYSDTIVMGRGDPDFDTPAHIITAAKDAMVEHHAEHVPPEGLPALRQAIAERVKRINGIDVDPETEVVVTNGGQEALFLMIITALGPGDEIIVPEPNYNTYADSIKFADAVQVGVPTFAEHNFRLDPADVRKAITDRTRALLLVSPNNPAASVISREDLEAMIAIAQEYDLLIIADDIYDLFVYDDTVHVSPASLPGGKERTLTLNALSKSYAMTGWRLGWIVGPADLMASVKAYKAAISGGTSIIAQYAGIAALTGPQEPVQMMADAYTRRRRILLDALDELGIHYGVPQGGQFVYMDVSFTGLGSADLAQRLLTEQHILLYPGAAFSKDSREYLRMTFLQPEDKLREGVERMKAGMSKILADA